MQVTRRSFTWSLVGAPAALHSSPAPAAGESIGARLRHRAAIAAAGNPVEAAIDPLGTLTVDGTHDAATSPKRTFACVGPPSFAPSQAMRWRGGIPSRKYAGAGDFWMGTPVVRLGPGKQGNWSSATDNGSGSATNAAYSSVEIMLEGRFLEVEWLANSIQGGVRYIIDGRYHATAGEGVAAGRNVHHLDFGSRSVRRVMVEWSPAGALRGLATEATGTLSAPAYADDFTVAVVGDSVAAGLTPPTLGEPDAWPVRLMHLMGWPDIAQVAIGGTGYVNAGPATPYLGFMLESMAAVHAHRQIGAIVFWGSTNDRTHPRSAVATAALRAFRAARTAYPGAPIFVFGSTDGDGNLGSDIVAVERGLGDAVAAMRDPATFFTPVSTAARPWIAGTGRQGRLKGDGNADFAIGPDGIHPSAEGHALIARHAASSIRGLLPLLP